MNVFEYVRPTSVSEAVAAAGSESAAYLAGGTNLMDLMKAGVAQPARIVDISHLPELGRIETLPSGDMRIGALVSNADLARDAAFAAAAPAVAEALLSGASPQLRNAATVGGNLMQGTRCAYFYDPHSACNRRTPGAGCDARGGNTASHAVLGWSDSCIATNPSDLCVPLVALDAVVEIAGPNGTRETALAAFHNLPGETPAQHTALAAGEMITAVRLPAGAGRFAGHSRYLKVRERTSFAFALVSAAAALTLENGVIAEARLALGGVAARPWRVPAAEAVLTGSTPDGTLFRRAAEAALEGARPSGNNGYKIELAIRTATRALSLAASGTPAQMPAMPGSVFASTTINGDQHG
ncbi:xanthine dehydrogenase family protein subunit M [Acuticoccus sp. MNP-M23]|uniref:FAD binding domain-containing protein n=1 Tax=Acuticoccus sp. MNP-M23 TaxID=3072793 RepID=UPI00281542D3|nr:xanthine dehydrogenase family protein subunit M [Acuticoccus sp. MNP-M23]WMS41385.1 xanthine dehydrogenase family protein subunit M [Acuticoccus sp. MNP-M23]